MVGWSWKLYNNGEVIICSCDPLPSKDNMEWGQAFFICGARPTREREAGKEICAACILEDPKGQFNFHHDKSRWGLLSQYTMVNMLVWEDYQFIKMLSWNLFGEKKISLTISWKKKPASKLYQTPPTPITPIFFSNISLTWAPKITWKKQLTSLWSSVYHTSDMPSVHFFFTFHYIFFFLL